MSSPEICPICGAEVPERAKACPQCGACDETGWSESAAASNLGLPDDEFDYEEFTQREFGGKTPKPDGLKWLWWIVALALLVGILITWLR